MTWLGALQHDVIMGMLYHGCDGARWIRGRRHALHDVIVIMIYEAIP